MFLALILPLTYSLPASPSFPDDDCGHDLDCEAQGNGLWPDPYNCRQLFYLCSTRVLDHEDDYCSSDILLTGITGGAVEGWATAMFVTMT